jgi:hypothetical protein
MPSSVLNHDLPCCKCGYNLRGLSRTNKCPECGQFVCDSIDRLVQLAAKNDIRKLNSFDRFCAVLAVALGIVFLLLGVVGFFFGSSANFTLPPLLGGLPALIGWGILRSVRIAWGNGRSIGDHITQIRQSPAAKSSIYRDPIPTLPADIDDEIEQLGYPYDGRDD